MRHLLTLFACCVAGASLAHAYTFTGSRWTASTITMHLQLGPSGTLTDGSPSWNASAEEALMTWNNQIARTRFAVVRDSTAAIGKGNRVNNVFFSKNLYGEAWGSGVLAVTLTYSTSGSQSVETDVVFNGNLSWDSYRGSTRYGSAGTIFDFRRVVLHEFGHALGLDHPDQAGQSVTALMNSRISNLDTLAADDIAGAQSLYGSATATVIAPTIVSAPTAQTVTAGDRLTLSVSASGSPAPAYQWQKNGSNIAGATSPTLVINTAAPTDAGTYSVTLTNSAGSVTTVPVLVTVKFSQLINLSTRGVVPAGGALTAGFALRGTADKALVVRGIGPTLTGYGVGNALPDPQLAVISQSTAQTLASNDTWGTAPQLATTFRSVGAFPLPAGSLDSASAVRLGAGLYTTRITSGPGSPAGVALAEVYDAEPGTYANRLVNLSTRGFTGTGDNALVAGFTVHGTATKRVLVRAVGPGLTTFGVTGFLMNPRLEVFASGQSTALLTNDDWGGTAELKTVFTQSGAFPLAEGSKDAAAVLTLAPGGYTVVVTGVGDTTGNVLVEIYDLEP